MRHDEAHASGTLTRLDVLSGDECQQCERVGLLLVELESHVLSCPDQLVGVVDEL